MNDFQKPDLSSPLDLDGYLAQASKTSMLRGLFHQMIASEVKTQSGKSIGRESYIGLKYYSSIELTHLVIEAAQLLHPNLALRDGIRILGRKAYKTFIDNSTFAKVTFSLINNPSTLISSMGRMGSFIFNEGSITATNLTDNQSVLQFRGCWLLECMTIGGVEGLFEHLNRKHELTVRTLSRYDFEIKASWE